MPIRPYDGPLKAGISVLCRREDDNGNTLRMGLRLLEPARLVELD